MQPIVVSTTCQEYGGERFYLCGFYYQHKGERLHRRVWAEANGPIPNDWHVHHIDHDRSNNQLDNLACLARSEHLAHHGADRTPARLASWEAAIPRLREGNARLTREQRSAAGRRTWENRQLHPIVCETCGATHLTPFPTRTKFCGLNCKMAALRARRRAAA